MTRRECTCAGTAPGYPQHEDWCGKPEDDDVEELDEDEIAEGRLRARDYDGWARL